MRTIIVTLFASLLSSCVGPFTPMGPLNLYVPLEDKHLALSELPSDIKTFPKTIYFHRDSKYILKAGHELAREFINHNWKIYYSGHDVTNFFEVSNQSTIEETIIESKESFRMPPYKSKTMKSDLILEWQSKGQKFWYQWPIPDCHVFYDPGNPFSSSLRSMGPYQEKAELFTRLERAAKENNINPNFYAGILATLSDLDPKAISKDKKIGLAQIPFMEAILISKDKTLWPKSKRIESSPPFLLKLLLKFSLLDPDTDWRLNVEKSILAGAEYLKYINNFWASSNYAEIAKTAPTLYAKLVIASYILGPNKILELYRTYGETFDQLKSFSSEKDLIDLTFGNCSDFSSDKIDTFLGSNAK